MKELVFYLKAIFDALKGIGDKMSCNRIYVGDIKKISYDRTENGWVFNSVDVKTYGA